MERPQIHDSPFPAVPSTSSILFRSCHFPRKRSSRILPEPAIKPIASPQGDGTFERLTRSTSVLFAVFFFGVALAHLSLLKLPYYWDEGGYYIPAALDFFHTGTLIPQFTNAHPPLPNVLLGTLWHVVGYHILATRIFVCAFAAASLTAIFRLSQNLLNLRAAVAVTFLTAVYPIWFAQSTLAHADIFTAAFTLWAFVVYFQNPGFQQHGNTSTARTRQNILLAVLFSLSVLSKETAIVQPAALAGFELYLVLRRQSRNWQRFIALCFPLLPLLAWYAYHRAKTGVIFGNPVYLRYNATDNFTVTHIFNALRFRFLHLFWQRNIWLPVVLALACLFLSRRDDQKFARPSRYSIEAIFVLIAANWIAFSILGGALLTRYLLPVYPLILILCVGLWMERTRWWPAFAVLTAAAFISALWWNPPTAFAPEDNLTYRDMIVVHQQAIDFIAQHYPGARVLTAWPVAADLYRPELGYTQRRIQAWSIEDFSLPEIEKAAQNPGEYDTAVVFTTHYASPALRAYLLAHPNSRRGREFAQDRDLSPQEIASILQGTIVWKNDIDGEWAAVLRFNRSYEARLSQPHVFSFLPSPR